MSQRTPPEAYGRYRARIDVLDGLRGICALTVSCAHILIWSSEHVEEREAASTIIALLKTASIAVAEISVLIFFVLSGLVIGYATKAPFSFAHLKSYAVKRLLRIYPIYVISLIFGFVIAHRSMISGEFIADLAFCQMWLSKPPPGNGPLWSLHFEVVFYALYPLVWAFRIPPLLGGATLSALAFLLLLEANHLYVVAAYFSVWLLGLWLSRNMTTIEDELLSRRLLAPSLTILIAYFCSNIWTMAVMKVAPAVFAPVTFHPLTVVLASWSVVGVVALVMNTRLPCQGAHLLFLALLSVASIFYAMLRDLLWMPNYQVAIAALSVTPLLVMVDKASISSAFFARRSLRFIGHFSYGLYAIHAPLMIFLMALIDTASDFPIYCAAGVLALLVAMSIAWLLEIRIQPMFASLHRRLNLA